MKQRESNIATADAAPVFGALLGVALLAKYLDVSKRTVWKLAADGSIPRPFKIPGTTRSVWNRDDIDSCVHKWERA